MTTIELLEEIDVLLNDPNCYRITKKDYRPVPLLEACRVLLAQQQEEIATLKADLEQGRQIFRTLQEQRDRLQAEVDEYLHSGVADAIRKQEQEKLARQLAQGQARRGEAK